MTGIFDLPKEGWRYATDKSYVGVGTGWYKEDFDDTGWTGVEIGRFLEEQVNDYDGRSWCRGSFTAPAIQPGKRVFLAFGAVDDAARVWLNGQFVGERDIGWDQPFALEVTQALRPGQRNTIAVQIMDRGGFGGIWKSIKLMTR